MTFDQILKIIRDGSKTDWQKAADLHAGIVIGAAPYTLETSTLAAPPRKARTIKPKPEIENRDARPTQDDGEIG